MQAIAVTGGSSFIGRKLLQKLTEKEIRAKVLFREYKQKDPFHDVIYGDIHSETTFKRLFHNIDIVINLIGRFQPPFAAQLDANVIALNTICKNAIKYNVKKIIHISAAAAYGFASRSTSFTEESPLQPDTEYGLTKKLGEEVVYFYHNNTKLEYIIFRPTNVYGPGETHGVIYNFIKSINKSNKITIYGNGKQRRDFLYVDDMVDAIIKSLNYHGCEVFNMSFGETINLLDLVKIFEKKYNKKIPIIFKPAEDHVVDILTADRKKTTKCLHWNPKFDIEKGISLLINNESK